METVALEPDHIAESVSSIESDYHREHLYRQLGNLAEIEVADVISKELELDSEVTSRTSIETQTAMIADFYNTASTELGGETDTGFIWQQVFEKQLAELSDETPKYDKNDLAVNILVGNLLATTDLNPGFAKRQLDYKMWEVAKTRHGLDVLRAATTNMGICVATNDSERPFVSVIEQTQGHEALFMVTDRAVDLHTVNMPVHELQTAPAREVGWFFGLMANNGNFANFTRNLDFVVSKKMLIEDLVCDGNMSSTLLENTPLNDLVTGREIVDIAIQNNLDPTQTIDLSTLNEDDQIYVFYTLMDKQKHNLWRAFSPENGFSDLPSTAFLQMIESGYLNEYRIESIGAFKHLPAGSLQLLKDANVDDRIIAESLRNFESDEKKSFYQELLKDPYKKGYVVDNPDQFDFVDKADILQIARDEFGLYKVAKYIDKYTDGSDKRLIQELITEGCGTQLLMDREKLPQLDVEWLIDRLYSEGDFSALAYNMPFEMINESELFDKLIESQDSFCLSTTLTKFDTLDPQYVLDKCFETKNYTTISTNLQYFESDGIISRQDIYDRLKQDPEALPEIAICIDNFDFIDVDEFVGSLAKNQLFESIALVAKSPASKNVDAEKIYAFIENDVDSLLNLIHASHQDSEISFVSTIGSDRILNQLCKVGDLRDVAFALRSVQDINFHKQFFEDCLQAKDGTAFQYAIDAIKIDKHIVIERCLELGWEEPLIKWSNFNPLVDGISADDYPDYETLISWGAKAILLCYPDKYPEANRGELFANLMSKNDIDMIEKILEHPNTVSAPYSIISYLVASEKASLLYSKKELFDKAIFTPELLDELAQKNFKNFVDLYKYSGQSVSWIDKSVQLFGKNVSSQLLSIVRSLDIAVDSPLDKDMIDFGITRTGPQGVEQLKQAVANMRNELVRGSDEQVTRVIDEALKSKTASAILQQITRFSYAEWGITDQQEWYQILQNQLDFKDEVKPLGSEFVPSTTYKIRTLDAKQFDPELIDEDAANKYRTLTTSIDLALEIADQPAAERYKSLFLAATNLLSLEKTRLETIKLNLQDSGKPKAVQTIIQQITSIDSVMDMDTRTFIKMTRSNFEQLTNLKVKGLDHIVRAGAYAKAIRGSGHVRSLALSLKLSEPSGHTISVLDDFVEHVANTGSREKYFSTDSSRKALLRTSDTTALTKQLVKFQLGSTSGVSELQFVPSRGLLMELSGHIGDACWASNYKSIAAEFPNITALTFLKNPGKPTERLVGAGMIIDTVDLDTGQGVLVLRGTNPIENYINGIKSEDFFGALVDYAKSVAGDKKLAVVIDGATQAATNRPVLFEYMKQYMESDMQHQKPINLPPETTFNGYELSGKGDYPHPAYYIN